MFKSLISIVIPYYNDPVGLGRALQSIEDQRYAAVEIIVVDDGSAAAAREAFARLLANSPLHVRGISHIQNLGAAAARNTGLDAAEGQIICLLDSDDCFMSGKLEWVAAAFANPSRHLIFHRYRDHDGRESDNRGILRWIDHWPWWLIALKNPSVTPALCFRATPAIRFDERFRRFDDQLFLVTYCRAFGAAEACVFLGTHVPKPLIGAGGLSGDALAMNAAERQFIAALGRFGWRGKAVSVVSLLLLPLRRWRRGRRLGPG